MTGAGNTNATKTSTGSGSSAFDASSTSWGYLLQLCDSLLDPKINLDAAKGVMPKADDKTLKDSSKQLSRKIKGAMANGDRRHGWKLAHGKQSTTARWNGPSSVSLRTHQLRPRTLTRIERRATPTKIGAIMATRATIAGIAMMVPTVTTTVVATVPISAAAVQTPTRPLHRKRQQDHSIQRCLHPSWSQQGHRRQQFNKDSKI
jgi:hypothetical protein